MLIFRTAPLKRQCTHHDYLNKSDVESFGRLEIANCKEERHVEIEKCKCNRESMIPES